MVQDGAPEELKEHLAPLVVAVKSCIATKSQEMDFINHLSQVETVVERLKKQL